ncbi:Glycosyl hydrolase family 109 protein 1 precursor [Rubripirellula lacrimiformis]|uniref:Glycosyl hydrolase family 109 protein 1 n=1 Tax=Rubripirellula lacrimiformis TaxID=1930273 RepID=A0A517N4X1_9BACT|nr:Gfo/Idh/MocA family oxidoreductase [Rubripirellula lacrimiformis]QDT02175.1 Glycosyl hydrolase family 109 protein 1 precursor [Rubripirellula lacrimiformis]
MQNDRKLPEPSNIASQARRRTFLKASGSALVGATLAQTKSSAQTPHVSVDDDIRIGLIGCGGRGTGATLNALKADPGIRLVAMADAFEDRLQGCLQTLQRQKDFRSRIDVSEEMQFTGLDAYQKVLATDIDVVLLATPPGFRPLHLSAAIDAGKHVFAEKPAAVDPAGIRSVLASAAKAKEKGLFIVAGLHARYEPETIEMTRRVQDGAIGEILNGRMSRYGGGTWVKPRKPGQTDVEYQLSNWHYHTWLSGDFLIEQFVHEIDRMAWVMGGYPVSCLATGGRQTRTEEMYGHTYDHFAALYKFANGSELYTTSRQQKGCANVFDMRLAGTKGTCIGAGKTRYEIAGPTAWQSGKGNGKKQVGHQTEHDAFYRELRSGGYLNNGDYFAKSTLMAIMARESAYTGQEITWQQALDAKQDLMPDNIAWDTPVPPWKVAIPGTTKFA